MNMKFKMIAAAVALAASAGANATMDNFMSGNGSLAFIALDYTGSPISVTMDLGYNIDSFLPAAAGTSTQGTTIAWNFNTNTLSVNGAAQSGFDTAWSGAMAEFYASAQNAEVTWGVIAGDSLLTSGSSTPIRYLSSSADPLATIQNQTKANLSSFSLQDPMINANNLLQTTANGSVATSGAAYVGQTFGTAGKWLNKASFVALAAEGVEQAFYEIDGVNGISATKALVTPYAGSFNYAAGVLTYSVPAVPEPETYAMFLAGLGLMGAIARRRLNRA